MGPELRLWAMRARVPSWGCAPCTFLEAHVSFTPAAIQTWLTFLTSRMRFVKRSCKESRGAGRLPRKPKAK